MIEKYLIEYCSPTLASVKFASLFNAAFSEHDDMERQLNRWNILMEPKGIKLVVLRKCHDRALIYMYRPKLLQKRLDCPGVQMFLKEYGYKDFHVEAALSVLNMKFSETQDFPHEIGIFLDYPLEDVVGFIENNGQNYICCGCWKVYCNECEAQKMFRKYGKCHEVYQRLWENGRSVMQLTVAV